MEVWLTKSHEIWAPNEMCDFGKVCLTALHKAMGFLLDVYLMLNFFVFFVFEFSELTDTREK